MEVIAKPTLLSRGSGTPKEEGREGLWEAEDGEEQGGRLASGQDMAIPAGLLAAVSADVHKTSPRSREWKGPAGECIGMAKLSPSISR